MTIRLRLSDPVPRQAGNTVRVVYDGQGGVTTAGGAGAVLSDCFTAAGFTVPAFSQPVTVPGRAPTARTRSATIAAPTAYQSTRRKGGGRGYEPPQRRGFRRAPIT